MVKIISGLSRRRVLACGKPGLGSTPLMKIVWRRGAAHLCRYPSRLQRVGFDLCPAASDGKCQQNIAQLALRVGRRATPGSLGPEQIVHPRTNAAMHAGAYIDQSLRSFDQCRQDVGCQHIDGEDARNSGLRLHPPLAITNTSLWITPSKRASLLTSSATVRAPAMVDRSPETTPWAPGAAVMASRLRSSFRPCITNLMALADQ